MVQGSGAVESNARAAPSGQKRAISSGSSLVRKSRHSFKTGNLFVAEVAAREMRGLSLCDVSNGASVASLASDCCVPQ